MGRSRTQPEKLGRVIVGLVLMALLMPAVISEVHATQASGNVAEECDRLAARPWDLQSPGEGIFVKDIDWLRAEPACGEARRQYPGEPRFIYQLGRAKLRAGQHDEAIRLFSLAAVLGHVAAKTSLGWMFETGQGVPISNKQAARIFREAAAHGDVEALRALGIVYRDGLGVTKDHREASRLFHEAAILGHSETAALITELAALYWAGTEVPEDFIEAAYLLRKAASAGDASALSGLGTLYETGRGVAYDGREAARLFTLAIEQGDYFAFEQMIANSASYSRDFRYEMQRILAGRDFYDGEIDGTFGPRTRSALEMLASEGYKVSEQDSPYFSDKETTRDLAPQALPSEMWSEIQAAAQHLEMLIAAAASGDTELIALLVEAGAGVDGVDNQGWSALAHAVANNQADATELLLALGARPTHAHSDASPSMIAAVSGSADVMERLIAFRLPPYAFNISLRAAAVQGNDSLVSRMIAAVDPTPKVAQALRDHVERRYGIEVPLGDILDSSSTLAVLKLCQDVGAITTEVCISPGLVARLDAEHPEAPSNTKTGFTPLQHTSTKPTVRVKSEISLGYLNLRSGPGQDHDVVDRIPAGSDGVELIGECVRTTDGVSRFPFCQVEWNGRRGWVSINGLE